MKIIIIIRFGRLLITLFKPRMFSLFYKLLRFPRCPPLGPEITRTIKWSPFIAITRNWKFLFSQNVRFSRSGLNWILSFNCKFVFVIWYIQWKTRETSAVASLALIGALVGAVRNRRQSKFISNSEFDYLLQHHPPISSTHSSQNRKTSILNIPLMLNVHQPAFQKNLQRNSLHDFFTTWWQLASMQR